MGGQAVMEGIMMRGETKTALARGGCQMTVSSINVPYRPRYKEAGKMGEAPARARSGRVRIDSLVAGTRHAHGLSRDPGVTADEEDVRGNAASRSLAQREVRQPRAHGISCSMRQSFAGDWSFTVGIFIILPTGDREPDEAC